MAQPARLNRFLADEGVLAAAADWQVWLAAERRCSRHTLDAYERDLAKFFTFLAEHLGEPASLSDLATLKAADFRAYLARRASEGISARTAARAMSCLRGFFRHLDRTERVKNAALRGRIQRQQRNADRWFLRGSLRPKPCVLEGV